MLLLFYPVNSDFSLVNGIIKEMLHRVFKAFCKPANWYISISKTNVYF